MPARSVAFRCLTGLFQRRDGFGRNFFRRITVVSGKGIQHRLVPHPVLQHLGWCLDEILRHRKTCLRHKARTTEDAVHHMPELMEQRIDVTVLEQ